jgi:hypothetical protein
MCPQRASLHLLSLDWKRSSCFSTLPLVLPSFAFALDLELPASQPQELQSISFFLHIHATQHKRDETRYTRLISSNSLGTDAEAGVSSASSATDVRTLLEGPALIVLLPPSAAKDTSGQAVGSARLGKGPVGFEAFPAFLPVDLTVGLRSGLAFFEPGLALEAAAPFDSCFELDPAAAGVGCDFMIEDDDEEATAFAGKDADIFSFLACQILTIGVRIVSGRVASGAIVATILGGSTLVLAISEPCVGVGSSDARSALVGDSVWAVGVAVVFVVVAKLLQTVCAAPLGSALFRGPFVSLSVDGLALLSPASFFPLSAL